MKYLKWLTFGILFVTNVPAHGASLSYKIKSKDEVKKGGDFKSGAAPKYRLIRVKAFVVDRSPKFSKGAIEESLKSILEDVKKDKTLTSAGEFHGISAELYQSRKHLTGGNTPIATADWWPKGHSFAISNKRNIENKATHETKINVMTVPTEAKNVLSRIPKNKRMEIFTESVKCEDRANADAKKKFPNAPANYPMNKLRAYYIKINPKRSNEADRLLKKYTRQLLKKYKITQPELKKISFEGMEENWPMPE